VQPRATHVSTNHRPPSWLHHSDTRAAAQAKGVATTNTNRGPRQSTRPLVFRLGSATHGHAHRRAHWPRPESPREHGARTHARCCNQAPRPRTNEPFPSTQHSCLALLRAPPSSEKLARPPCRSEREPAANHASTDDQPSASLSYTSCHTPWHERGPQAHRYTVEQLPSVTNNAPAHIALNRLRHQIHTKGQKRPNKEAKMRTQPANYNISFRICTWSSSLRPSLQQIKEGSRLRPPRRLPPS
jgi:hypothetical protein